MSHEQSIGIEMDGRYFNLPTVYNGQKVSERDAVELFRQGKIRPLGQYSTQVEADREASKRSKSFSHEGAHMAVPGDEIAKDVAENIGIAPIVTGAGKMGGSLIDLLSRLISGMQGGGGRMAPPPQAPPPAVGQQAQQGADPMAEIGRASWRERV